MLSEKVLLSLVKFGSPLFPITPFPLPYIGAYAQVHLASALADASLQSSVLCATGSFLRKAAFGCTPVHVHLWGCPQRKNNMVPKCTLGLCMPNEILTTKMASGIDFRVVITFDVLSCLFRYRETLDSHHGRVSTDF